MLFHVWFPYAPTNNYSNPTHQRGGIILRRVLRFYVLGRRRKKLECWRPVRKLPNLNTEDDLYGSGRSFATISVARPERRNALCSIEKMVYPLRFSFISPVHGELPFLFLVQFLRRLIGICHFSWFSPGSRSYEMVYTHANDVD